MLPWQLDLRQRFPATRTWTYLNTAAAGPVALEVARAGCEVYESLLGSGDNDFEEFLDATEQARLDLATLAGCEPAALAFTRNTSHSVSLVADMLWERGLRTVVALADEFPASTLPWLNRGFDVRFVQPVDGRYPVERISEALEGRHVLVASHVMYRTGHAIDPVAFGNVARAHGAEFVLTATQSLGALRVDFEASGASFLVGTSHKWLCAGFGAGYLAMRPELVGTMRWPQVGWLSNRDAGRMRNDVLDVLPEARALEMGCPPFQSILTLGAAVRLWLWADPERVETRVRGLTRALRERLRAAGFDAPDAPTHELSGITVVPVADANRVCQLLKDESVATTPRGSGVRLAVHAFNDERDLDRAVEVLARVTAT